MKFYSISRDDFSLRVAEMRESYVIIKNCTVELLGIIHFTIEPLENSFTFFCVKINPNKSSCLYIADKNLKNLIFSINFQLYGNDDEARLSTAAFKDTKLER